MLGPARVSPQAALRDLHHPRPRVRLAAIAGLAETLSPVEGTLEQQICDALRRALTDENEEVRLHAATALGGRRDSGALDLLARQADSDPSARARQGAVIGLGLLADGRASAVLFSALDDRAADVRFHAVAALAQLGPPGAGAALRPLLADPDAEVRGNAAAALGDLADRESCDHLARSLDDLNPAVAFEAAVALSSLGDSRGTDQLATQLGHRERGLAAAHRLFVAPDPAALGPLEAQAARRFCDPLARVWIAGALVRLGATDKGRPLLLRALQSRKAPVRGLAIEVLGALHQDWATDALATASDADTPAR